MPLNNFIPSHKYFINAPITKRSMEIKKTLFINSSNYIKYKRKKNIFQDE